MSRYIRRFCLIIVPLPLIFVSFYYRNNFHDRLIRITRPSQSFFDPFENLFKRAFRSNEPPPLKSPNQATPPSHSYESTKIAGIHLVLRIPVQPTGIALLFHACDQNAHVWFNLPEHRRLTDILTSQNVAAIGITAENEVTRCFSSRYPPESNVDVQRTLVALHQVVYKQDLQHLPLFALGVSMGASFASVLSSSNQLQIMNQVLYLSLGNQRAFCDATQHYPSTLFVFDAELERAVPNVRDRLLSRNVKVVGEMLLRKPGWTADVFHRRDARISISTSKLLYSEIQKHGGYFERALTNTSFHEVQRLRQNKASRAAVEQILRVVRGEHELCSSYGEHVISWLIQSRNAAK